MNVKVHELMAASVITIRPHATVEHMRNMLERDRVGAIPVVNPDGHPVGIVPATDLASSLKPGSPIRTVMTEKV